MLNYTITTALIAIAFGCSTPEKVSKVDRDTSQVTVYSSPDSRSAIPDAKTAKTFIRTSEKLDQEIKNSPRDTKSIINLAQIRVMQGSLDDAENLAKRALRLDLKNTDAKKVLAEVAIRRENYDLAAIILGGLGGSASKDSQTLNMLALVALHRNDNAEAMALFKRALQLNPDDISARMNLGVLQLKHRQMGAAAVQFERVLKSMPDHRDAKLHLAIIKATRGQTSEAEEAYRGILAVKKDNPLALFNLAVVQKQAGNFDDALDNLKKYLQSRPTDGSQTADAFALIDEIQNERAARGERVSDDEIQALAARMADQKENRQDKAKVATRTAPRDETKPSVPTNTAPAKSAAPAATQPAPVAQQKPAVAPAKRPVHETDDIGELEKALE